MDVVDWEASAPAALVGDPLWRMHAYRAALFAVDLGWSDARRLGGARVTEAVGAQLYRALGSVPANIAEGYSRSSGADRVRFFEYALGSVRESITWYIAARPILGAALGDQRCGALVSIRRQLLAIIPAERRRRITRHAE